MSEENKISVDCPNCEGKGVWRRHWNEPYTSDYGRNESTGYRVEQSTIDRYSDEKCPRCGGLGKVI